MKIVRTLVQQILHSFGYGLVNFKKQDKLNFIWLEKYNIKTALDIGANEGQFALSLNKHVKNLNIYSFEPIKDTYEKFKINTRHFKHITCYNFALGEKNETSIINLNQHSPSSSILPLTEIHLKSYPEYEKATEESIVVKRLDDVVPEFSLDLTNDYLVKIDVQGFEGKVIEGGKNTLSKAKIIIIEISFQELYKDQPLFNDIYEKLTNMGFKFKGVINTATDSKSGLPLFTDGIFIKE